MRVRTILTVASAALLVTASMPTLAGAASKITEVVVRNTTAEPVPTQAVGTTAVTGAVSVNGPVTVEGAVDVGNFPATQSVTGTVRIDGPVTTAGQPIEPWSLYADDWSPADYVVPEGKRLRIRMVSGQVTVDNTHTGGYIGLAHCPADRPYCSGAHLRVPLAKAASTPATPTTGNDVYNGSMLVDVVVPAGHAIELFGGSFLQGGQAGVTFFSLSAFGELEDAA